MVDLGDWIDGITATPKSRLLKEQRRAAEAWRRILEHDPKQIVFKTAAGVKLPVQTVRLESDNGATASVSTAGGAPTRKVFIYGIKNHANLPNTDIKEKYTFVMDNDLYTCVDVIVVLGEIQAIFEATG